MRNYFSRVIEINQRVQTISGSIFNPIFVTDTFTESCVSLYPACKGVNLITKSPLSATNRTQFSSELVFRIEPSANIMHADAIV